MRRFKLQNAAGTEWDLMRKDAYFNAPDGLGFSKSIKTVQAGYSWLKTEDTLDEPAVSGEMVFKDYLTYQQFITFISQLPLKLFYASQETWYQIPCEIQSVGKSEMRSNNLLYCPIAIACFGAWRERSIVKPVQSVVTASKKYTYTYPYKYADTVAGSVIIENGNIPSPCKLHIFGPVANPSWSVVQGGVKILDGKVNITIPAGNKLVVDADPLSMEITEQTKNGDFVANRYQNSDFSTSRFVIVPAGISTISFLQSGTEPIDALVEVSILAASV